MKNIAHDTKSLVLFGYLPKFKSRKKVLLKHGFTFDTEEDFVHWHDRLRQYIGVKDGNIIILLC